MSVVTASRKAVRSNPVTDTWLLAKRALRETARTPEATFPTLFIPLFFLIVNVGQAGRVFPSGRTEFLYGQNYMAFQLPVSLLLAVSFGSAAMYLVEEIENGYFDKLRAAPIARTSLVMGRLLAEGVKGVFIALIIVLIALPFGVHIDSGPLGWVLLLLLTAGWGVAFCAFMQLIAIKTRNLAATQSGSMVFFPVLFVTPNFVPREMLTRPMEIAATYNPLTYVMEAIRQLILQPVDWAVFGKGLLVVVVVGAIGVALNVRAVNSYD